mmetsp:Transcript_49315/g.115379  ORF Transcript_49315/g.115379 Transcript_49315/m.115379 type:complete len:174 (-) Transcript_49315:288-809(-)
MGPEMGSARAAPIATATTHASFTRKRSASASTTKHEAGGSLASKVEAAVAAEARTRMPVALKSGRHAGFGAARARPVEAADVGRLAPREVAVVVAAAAAEGSAAGEGAVGLTRAEVAAADAGRGCSLAAREAAAVAVAADEGPAAEEAVVGRLAVVGRPAPECGFEAGGAIVV